MSGPVGQNTIEKGREGEQLACDYLVKQNIHIIERNISYKFGEIDIIAKDKEVLCFIEVRSRLSCQFGRPEATVGPKKQSQIIRAASAYLQSNFKKPPICRFDVIAITGFSAQIEIKYLKNAFGVQQRFGGIRGNPWRVSYR